MNLLSFEEIQKRLDKEFIPLEPMLKGYRLNKGGLEENTISKCESTLSVNFPLDYRRLISIYDFGNLTIGPVAFCATGDYSSELIDYNEHVAWWGEDQRPSNLIMIANSDPFAILLEVNTGEIFAMDTELGWKKSTRISESFEKFVRGIGTVILLRSDADDKEKLANTVNDIIGSQNISFWTTLAK